ncbi:MAG: hypothetical protein AAFU03_09670, partial [Bacteroidota bacterium]
MKRFLLPILIICFSFPLLGQLQSFDGYMIRGAKAEAMGDHYTAYQLYRIAQEYPKREDDPEVLFRLGESAFNARAYKVSEKALLTLANMAEVAEFPLTKYYLGQTNVYQGKYEQAKTFFQQFLDEQPEAEEKYRLIAEAQQLQTSEAIDQIKKARDVKMRNLGEPINTEFSDFGYTVRSGQAYVSQHKFKYETDTLNPRRKLSRIMMLEGGENPTALPGIINNPDRNVSHSAFNTAGDFVFYSV